MDLPLSQAERGKAVQWFGKRAEDMTRDELLALIGLLDYLIESREPEFP